MLSEACEHVMLSETRGLKYAYELELLERREVLVNTSGTFMAYGPSMLILVPMGVLRYGNGEEQSAVSH